MSFLPFLSSWLYVFLFINLLYCDFGWGQRQVYVCNCYVRPRSLYRKTLLFDTFLLLLLLQLTTLVMSMLTIETLFKSMLIFFNLK